MRLSAVDSIETGFDLMKHVPELGSKEFCLTAWGAFQSLGPDLMGVFNMGSRDCLFFHRGNFLADSDPTSKQLIQVLQRFMPEAFESLQTPAYRVAPQAEEGSLPMWLLLYGPIPKQQTLKKEMTGALCRMVIRPITTERPAPKPN